MADTSKTTTTTSEETKEKNRLKWKKRMLVAALFVMCPILIYIFTPPDPNAIRGNSGNCSNNGYRELLFTMKKEWSEPFASSSTEDMDVRPLEPKVIWQIRPDGDDRRIRNVVPVGGTPGVTNATTLNDAPVSYIQCRIAPTQGITQSKARVSYTRTR